MYNYAIICSAENQIKPNQTTDSSSYEKMSIILAHSIRACMPDIPVYLGNFTANKLSDWGKSHFERLNITLVEDLVFPSVHSKTHQGHADDLNGDYYVFSGFLRNFTKDYFAKRLLDQYDFLLYIDIDAIVLKPFEFDFDPTAPIGMIESVPEWIRKFMSRYTVEPLTGNLYLNWIDVINKHNMHIFDIDYTSPRVREDHASDVIISDRLDASQLTLVEQPLGGFYPKVMPTVDHYAYHYDSLGSPGTFFMLEQSHPIIYRKYIAFIRHVLKDELLNDRNHWMDIKHGRI